MKFNLRKWLKPWMRPSLTHKRFGFKHWSVRLVESVKKLNAGKWGTRRSSSTFSDGYSAAGLSSRLSRSSKSSSKPKQLRETSSCASWNELVMRQSMLTLSPSSSVTSTERWFYRTKLCKTARNCLKIVVKMQKRPARKSASTMIAIVKYAWRGTINRSN